MDFLLQEVILSGFMKLIIASKNPIKVQALREIIEQYTFVRGADIIALASNSGVGEQPTSLEETVRGAMNRAKNVFGDCVYSFGIESGLMEVPYAKSGFMDVCVCAIFDGEEIHIGLSSVWEAPLSVSRYILEDGLDMNQAAKKAGLTQKDQIGAQEGLVGIVTKGRLTRKEYTKQALQTAFIHLENK